VGSARGCGQEPQSTVCCNANSAHQLSPIDAIRPYLEPGCAEKKRTGVSRTATWRQVDTRYGREGGGFFDHVFSFVSVSTHIYFPAGRMYYVPTMHTWKKQRFPAWRGRPVGGLVAGIESCCITSIFSKAVQLSKVSPTVCGTCKSRNGLHQIASLPCRLHWIT